MIASGIAIDWGYGTEYIQMDSEIPTKNTVITTTIEYWSSERRLVNYNTSSRVSELKDGVVELIVSYNPVDNQHLSNEDVYWGNSIIRFEGNSPEGLVEWQDDDNSEHNGTVTWQRISGGLFKKPKREYYSKVKREQEKFRAAILTYDKSCTLSGENTSDALEAAHIIPSKDGGAEVVENGILLRADLHKLYDRGHFLIDPSGYVVTKSKDLSKAYKKLTSGARLPKPTVTRVKEALLYQWRNTRSHLKKTLTV